ncbi:MAG: hypothetical protein FJZ38_09735 [Candidatus Rokubacteria bacterium]|nr:hypothetical protein [Candidatus Rokubacteria bacterium]
MDRSLTAEDYWRSNAPAGWTIPAPSRDRAQLRQYVTDSSGTAQEGQHAAPQSMHPSSYAAAPES